MRTLLRLVPSLSELLEEKRLPFWKKLWLVFFVPFWVFLCALKLLVLPTTPKAIAVKLDGARVDDKKLRVTCVDDSAVHFTIQHPDEHQSQFTFGIDPVSSIRDNVKDAIQLVRDASNVPPYTTVPASWNPVDEKNPC